METIDDLVEEGKQEHNSFNEVPLEETLEEAIEENKKKPSKGKIALVDTVGNVTCSLIAGSLLDYFSGLNLIGIITARSYAGVVNALTGGLYGWWREKAFSLTKTTEESSKVRKISADLLAFNTFQVPVYASVLAVGSFVSEGSVDWDKVQNGSMYLAAISPLSGPIMGWYMDKCRWLFGVKPAVENAYNEKNEISENNKNDT